MSEVEIVKKPGVTIGGLGVTYQAILIDGKTLAFETAIDSTTDRADLDGLLDTVIEAAGRQQAKQELPLVKESLHLTLQQIAKVERARANTEARAKAKIEAVNQNRRVQKPLPDGEVNALAQYDQQLDDLRRKEQAARVRIPYLQAMIDRRDPPEMFPVQKPDDEAEAA